MKKYKLVIDIIKESKGYSAHSQAKQYAIFSDGKTIEKAKANMLEAINLTFEDKKWIYTMEELNFQYDLASFFEHYKIINAKALSNKIGMNQSLLSQYIRGIKKPSAVQHSRLFEGVKKLGKELANVEMI